MFQSSISIGDTRVFERLVAGLEIEFGKAAAQGLARHFIEAEDADFYWDARAAQRWLGTYEGLDDGDELLDRIAVFGRLDDRFYVAILIVDGAEAVDAMLGLRQFDSETEALEAYRAAR
ncbi:hypothetical protein BV97_05673 [Novosphingobium resinovorum]|uniref:Uncharacterized protein n=2 Tax=Sphingomonadaceae TaxID=41297 RepID=A0A031J425_9SPHN|nr:hypothetical protein BV97_05673 [Novosphingobium resinovorum]